MFPIRIALVAVILMQGVSLQAQDTTKKKATRKPSEPKVNPVFVAPEEQPGLPNVLLIGDSISIGYTLNVRRELQGVANVFRPPTNCGPTTKGIAEIDRWLGDRKWDVVHWNFGLHDLKYMGPKGQNLADPEAPDSRPQVPIEEYAANIKGLAERIKKAAKVVIWRETTPVPEGAKGRVVGDSDRYNKAAAKAIAEVGGIETDPFFAFAESIKDDQRPANVHYTPEGSKRLGQHVAKIVKDALKNN